MTAQVDEPGQKSCIYKVKRAIPEKKIPSQQPTSRTSNLSIKLPNSAAAGTNTDEAAASSRGSQNRFT